jgi:protein TonB
VPAVEPGTLVDINDPAVRPPVLQSQPRLVYPDIATVAGAEGRVELRALIDETGTVIEVMVVRSTRTGVQFETHADSYVRARKYRPATKGGVPVRTWMPIVVNFKLSR